MPIDSRTTVDIKGSACDLFDALIADTKPTPTKTAFIEWLLHEEAERRGIDPATLLRRESATAS